MRRLALLSALCVLELSACKHKGQTPASRGDGNTPLTADPGVVPVLSAVKMSDPKAEPQLVRGFYTVESHAWRWTSSRFAVVLLPPEGAAQQGASLEFKFSLPDNIVNKVGPVTLSAKINGMALSSKTYSMGGEYTYGAVVAADALRSGHALVEFSTDKFMPPSNGDKRELALVAVSVSLLPAGQK